ncbi:uncharacterized protein B0H64DRAFT_438025 [Chaetomium fimeti]|uniref:IBR domain-containing protein n=1 Tax=Chaetomium fimeti TaxID=1854472 RepID=A0AAE0HQL0_9PEZI|nr:hypothetical protein B0H64DRAFT_438025 [Chaetomium fimeti]
MNEVRGVFVDRTVIRMARHARGENLFQFCPRCHKLVMRAGGCNHMECPCGHDFCIICAGDWPVGGAEATQPLCHPFFGGEEEHTLRIPPEVQARLDEEESQPPAAYVDETAEGVLCRHQSDLLYTLRLRRELSKEERSHARALFCLHCRDAVWSERPPGGADSPRELDTSEEE